jgi:hypothetical protein
MSDDVTIVLDGAAIERLCSAPGGAVYRNLERRAIAVTNAAKALCPVDGGRLRASITYQLVVASGDLTARIGTNVEYARFVEEGTGMYGPHNQRIYPKTGQYMDVGTGVDRPGVHGGVLVFTPKGASAPVFARSTAGMRGRPYLRPALAAGM